MNKVLAQLSGRLVKPRCGGMEMQLCSLQRQLWIICFYLLKLHLKEMLLLCSRSLGFMYHAPIFGVCVREPNLSSRGGWDGCLVGAELLWNHCLPFSCSPPSSGYQNRDGILHLQQTHSISWGPVFPMNLFSTSQPSWAGGKEQGGSGSSHLKHFSSLDNGDVI